MKVWLLLYVGSQLHGFWGPLPSTMAECQQRAAEQQLKVEMILQDPAKLAEMRWKGLNPEDLTKWQFKCEKRTFRPFLNEA